MSRLSTSAADRTLAISWYFGSGPTGEFVQLNDSVAGRVRADGSYVSITADSLRFEVYAFET